MTDATASERLKAMNTRFAALAKAAPRALGSFRSLMLEASKAGTLQAKFKELIAVAIAVHQGCGDCILFHVSNAKSHGATRAERAETLAVCIEMGGGPSSVYAGHALAAYDESSDASTISEGDRTRTCGISPSSGLPGGHIALLRRSVTGLTDPVGPAS